MFKTIKKLIHKSFRLTGYDFMKYDDHHFSALIKHNFIKSESIDLVIDVGAHEGHYVTELRDSGYKGRVISFEPQSQSFSVLNERAKSDKNWQCIHAAVGERKGVSDIFISGRKTSSSLLAVGDAHIKAVPASATVSTETVTILALDSFLGREIKTDDRIFLKIDVQGYEMFVLHGALQVLNQVRGLEIELSFVQLYQNAPVFSDMVDYLKQQGFILLSLNHVLRDPQSGQLLQVDGVFRKYTT